MGLQPGICTLIVARVGPPDPQADDALLRAVEAEAGWASGRLDRTRAMDRPEFRLVEAIDRPTADRLAGMAARAGYRPRVRDRLGIKWSNQRRPDGVGPALMVMSICGAAVGLAAAFGGSGHPLAPWATFATPRRSTGGAGSPSLWSVS